MAKNHPHLHIGCRPPTLTFGLSGPNNTFCRAHTTRQQGQTLTLHILQSAMKVIPSIYPACEVVLYKAIINTSFHLSTHVGELATSNWETDHIILRENILENQNSITIIFGSYKHYTSSIPHFRVLEWNSTIYCPIKLLKSYLQIPPGPHNGHLFHHQNSSTMSAAEVGQILKCSLHIAGFDTSTITPHSLRIRATTVAVA